MPLKRHPHAFSHPEWLFEIKHDGFGALAVIRNGRCELVSRNGNSFTSFETLRMEFPRELGASDAVLDGEIVCLDETGKSQFNELLFRRGEPRFFAFDVLWCEGADLRFDGLLERNRKLRALVPPRGERLLYCDHIERQGEELFRLACENDLEGIVAKPKNSPYVFRESETHWLKIRNLEYSQWLGRDELFSRSQRDTPTAIDGWAGCALVCAEAEL